MGFALGETTRAAALEEVASFLERHGVEEARRDARALLLAAGDWTAADLLLDPEAPLPREARRRLDDFARRRAAREPVTRIVGRRGFWTNELVVVPHVLDPRADTETLVESAIGLMRERRGEPLAILDLGVGSGAILCALLTEFPAAHGVGVDLCAKACAAAASNLARCGVSRRASILRGRWAQAIETRFDLVVSNPPYVESAEIDALAPEVRLHDPRLALDGGADGLACYREIAADLRRILAPGGAVTFEVGAGQAGSVAALLGERGLEIAEIRRDLGGHERAVAARGTPRGSWILDENL
jgi:release factor glutamine methyltransferase